MSNRSGISFILVTAALLAVSSFLLAAPSSTAQMRPGQWEVNATIDMPGMPMQIPPLVTSTCLSKEDVKDPDKTLPKPGNGDCSISDYKVDGNKITWNMKCTGRQPMTGNGAIAFTGDTYEGTVHMMMPGKDSGPHEMNMKFKAKRTGDCSK